MDHKHTNLMQVEPSTTEIEVEEPNQPVLLTADELASLLRLSKRTLWRLRSAGKIPPPVRLGACVRWRVVDIDAWLAAGCPARVDIDGQRHSRKSR